jgi:lipase maturation factor 1
VARSLFLRGLALIYLIAFASLLPQMSGLIGAHGILPVHDYLETVHSDYGSSSYTLFPTLAWLDSSDTFIKGLVWAGVAFSLCLLAGLIPLPATIFSFLLYLSLDTVGQVFYSFQWDALLLETGFAAILLAPWGLRPSYSAPVPRVTLWVFRFLIFRLMLESGAAKLLSGDTTWRNLTALKYHYETQPLPTPVAWYAHQVPILVQKLSVIGVFVVELIAPFFFFTKRRVRVVAAIAAIALQLMIALTGNYTFFNLLTILLCVFLFNVKTAERTPAILSVVGVVLITLGMIQLVTMSGIVPELPRPIAWIQLHADTFHVMSQYGLFANMTTTRPEIIIEGSDDGVQWKAYEFKYKPGDVKRRLPWVAPYQPRLDWQMWFAALSSPQQNPWFSRLIVRLLEGQPEVTNLLAVNPFPGKPPHFIRAEVYDYHFTDWSTRRTTGAIWSRNPLGEYFPVVSLR